jgi:hypothetical protein
VYISEGNSTIQFTFLNADADKPPVQLNEIVTINNAEVAIFRKNVSLGQIGATELNVSTVEKVA